MAGALDVNVFVFVWINAQFTVVCDTREGKWPNGTAHLAAPTPTRALCHLLPAGTQSGLSAIEVRLWARHLLSGLRAA